MATALKEGFYRVELNKTVWNVPERYRDLLPIGVGAFGSVCSARDGSSGSRVAIKKLSRPFQGEVHAKRCYRELLLLKHMSHDNVIRLLDVFTPTQSYDCFNDVYLVTELMGSDLHKIIRTQLLSDDHVQIFVYQILRGLKYIHSAGIIHRVSCVCCHSSVLDVCQKLKDLKPSNIGVSEDCDIKILDFGLGRRLSEEMTGYVMTRFWRAPEIMLNWMHYDQKADIWSVGCVMAELLTGQVLFPGNDYRDHLTRILQLCGTPDQETLSKIECETAQSYILSLPFFPKKDLYTFFVGANPLAVDLLQQLLCLDPHRRPSAEQALGHPYLAKYHVKDDEPVCQRKYDDSFEQLRLDAEGWRKLVYEELSHI